MSIDRGLIVLVLDLGRPDRLIVAMTTFNFKSIFAWNVFLYSGFMAVVTLYLWMMFEARYNKFIGKVGTFAFIWRVTLTTGTGSIFAFLVAKEAYNGALLAPLFIALSLLVGTAVFYKILFWMDRGLDIPMGSEIVKRFLQAFNLLHFRCILYNCFITFNKSICHKKSWV